MKITKYPSHITIEIGKKWISLDKTGIMGWNGKRNWFVLWNRLLNN